MVRSCQQINWVVAMEEGFVKFDNHFISAFRISNNPGWDAVVRQGHRTDFWKKRYLTISEGVCPWVCNSLKNEWQTKKDGNTGIIEAGLVLEDVSRLRERRSLWLVQEGRNREYYWKAHLHSRLEDEVSCGDTRYRTNCPHRLITQVPKGIMKMYLPYPTQKG